MKQAVRRRSAGMTLVELMVAMLVGLLITLAAVSALIAARRGFASVDAASQLRDNARFATEFIRRLAVQSGYKDLLYATTKRGSSIGISVDPLPNVFGFDNALASKNSLDAGIARPNGTYGDVLVLRFQDIESLPGSNTADGSMIDCAGFSNDGALPADRNRDSTRTSVLFVNTSNDGEPTLMCYRSSTGSLPFDNARPMIRGVENFQVLKVKNAAQHVAVLGDDAPFLVVKVNGAAQLIMGGQDVVYIGHVGAENAENVFHNILNSDHNGAEHRHEHPHDGGNGKRYPVGIGDCIGLGHDLSEDEHKDGHCRRRNDGAAVTECLDEDCRGDSRGRDVGDIVAEQDCADEPLAGFGQAQHE